MKPSQNTSNQNQKSSRLKGFYELLRGERLDLLCQFTDLPVDQARLVSQDGALDYELTNLFIENAIGNYPLPLGIVTSFKINQKDFIIPFAVEESSVVAATSNAARMAYDSGGFQSETLSHLMIGQIQLLDIPPSRFKEIENKIINAKMDILREANEFQPRLVMRGGGTRDLEIRCFPDAEIPFMVLHLLIDTKDAMGANLVNTVCESVSPMIQELTGARIGLRILSNLADRRLYRASCSLDPEVLKVKGDAMSGQEVARRIVEAFVFADNDPYRAATHNKGIMNGIDPVVIATGNDWRAVEAGAHAFAAKSGRYRSLTKWSLDKQGRLHGNLEIPLQLGTVGGVTRLHPLSRIAMQILGNPNTNQLGEIIACCGLASNLAALRALVTSGIQKGHMKLHAKNLALAAGARGKEVEIIASELVAKQKLSAGFAEELLAEFRELKRKNKFVEPALANPQ